MPVIQRAIAIAANSVNDNLVAGSAFEITKQRSIVSIGVAQSATGLFVSIQGGADIIAEEFEPAILARFPIIPDEMYYTDVLEQLDRLVIRCRNSTAGALTARIIVQLQPY